MKEIKAYLAKRQHELAAHRVFRWLETTHDREGVAHAFSTLAFWVASVQDVLAANELRIDDVRFREIAWHHRREDAGHDKWFFEDLRRLGVAAPTGEQLFAKRQAPIRAAVHALMAEVFHATCDLARVTLLLSLESTGHIFFESTADWAERAGVELKYFSRFHVEIEQRHELFERELHVFLDAIELDRAMYERCIGVIDRAHAAFELMFDTLVLHSCREPSLPLHEEHHEEPVRLARAG